jgi:hypothetical protein
MSLNLKTEQAKKYTKNEVILIIREYVIEQIELSRREMLDKDNFSKAGWSEHQAFQLGIQKAYSKLEAFLPDPEGN